MKSSEKLREALYELREAGRILTDVALDIHTDPKDLNTNYYNAVRYTINAVESVAAVLGTSPISTGNSTEVPAGCSMGEPDEGAVCVSGSTQAHDKVDQERLRSVSGERTDCVLFPPELSGGSSISK